MPLRLMEYRWHVVGRRQGTPDFITSDMPLVALWSPGMEKRRPPFFGEPGNAFRFPLDRNFILHGISSGRLHARQLDRSGVEEANAYTAFHGARFVYCSADSFAAKFPDEPLRGVEGILHAHKRRQLIHDMSGGPGFQKPSPEEIKSWMRWSPQ
jgi:hypothetical protein